MESEISSLEEAYSILGLDNSASESEVNSAFRKLAAKYHPDVNKDNPDAEKMFKKINSAKQIIDNPDKFRHVYQEQDHGFNVEDIRDMFRNVWRGDVSHNNVRQRPHPVINVSLTFKESVLGARKDLSFKRYGKCTKCNGDSVFKSSKQCKHCDGKGQFSSKNKNVIFGTICHHCQGSGKELKPCKECAGWGTVEEEVTINVNIPFGVIDGQVLRAPGGGNFVGRGFGRDAYSEALLKIQVESDPDMTLDGQDVISTINLTLLDALKGTNVKVKTIDGEKTLKIRPESKNGQQIVFNGGGAGRIGNHVFNLSIEYPKNVNELIEFLEKE